MAATAVWGVWPSCAGAFLYGLFLVGLDLAFSAWRFRRGEKVPPGRVWTFIVASFLVRVFLLLAGMAVALRIFAPPGRLVVGLVLLGGIPVGIITAKRFAMPKGG